MTVKMDRHSAIARIIKGTRPKTQRALADLLVAEGFDATQATVSRDMAEMGVEKRPRGYLLGEEARLVKLLRDLVVSVDRAANLVVIKSIPGGAQGVAAAIDGVGIGDVMGSIAGDDTILVIACDDPGAGRFVEELGKYRSM